MTIEAEFYKSVERDEWDRFVASSANGGLLHTRRFLDYHNTRIDRHALSVVHSLTYAVSRSWTL